MWFDGWDDLLRIALVGSCAYAGLVVILRITGKRTLSKMNAFDMVVTVALGSTLAAATLNADVSFSEGLAAFALLCALQYAATFLAVRSARFRSLIKSEPKLVYHGGDFLPDALKVERVTREEIEAAARGEGYKGLEGVASVVLETDGSFSVIGGAAPASRLFTQGHA